MKRALSLLSENSVYWFTPTVKNSTDLALLLNRVSTAGFEVVEVLGKCPGPFTVVLKVFVRQGSVKAIEAVEGEYADNVVVEK